jgi:hypothetical protein
MEAYRPTHENGVALIPGVLRTHIESSFAVTKPLRPSRLEVSEISDQKLVTKISDQTGRIPQNCSNSPINLRERVLTIDNDSRMSPPPFERALAVGREVVSDIQAFGYDPDDPQQTAFSIRPPAALSFFLERSSSCEVLTDGTIPLFTTYSLVDVPSVSCSLLILRSHLLHENQGCCPELVCCERSSSLQHIGIRILLL